VADQIFMILDGITGESTDKQFPKSVEVLSLSYGAHLPAAVGGGGTVGTPTIDDIVVGKRVDTASLGLLRALLEGIHISTGRIMLRRVVGSAAPVVFLEVDLTGVSVRAVTSQDASASEAPAEQVSLTFESVTWIYTPVGPTGLPGAKMSYTYKSASVL
jgi:type VI secretion system secreted protein Hcp